MARFFRFHETPICFTLLPEAEVRPRGMDMKKRVTEKDEIMRYIGEVQPDILCFQEYFWDKSEQLQFHTTDTLLEILNLEDMALGNQASALLLIHPQECTPHTKYPPGPKKSGVPCLLCLDLVQHLIQPQQGYSFDLRQ